VSLALQVSIAVFSGAVVKFFGQRWLSPLEKNGPYICTPMRVTRFNLHTEEAAVNAEEQQITLQLIDEPRIATTPSTIAQTASNELVVIAPDGCKQYHNKTLHYDDK